VFEVRSQGRARVELAPLPFYIGGGGAGACAWGATIGGRTAGLNRRPRSCKSGCTQLFCPARCRCSEPGKAFGGAMRV
jgi:hypothetical protein